MIGLILNVGLAVCCAVFLAWNLRLERRNRALNDQMNGISGLIRRRR